MKSRIVLTRDVLNNNGGALFPVSKFPCGLTFIVEEPSAGVAVLEEGPSAFIIPQDAFVRAPVTVGKEVIVFYDPIEGHTVPDGQAFNWVRTHSILSQEVLHVGSELMVNTLIEHYRNRPARLLIYLQTAKGGEWLVRAYEAGGGRFLSSGTVSLLEEYSALRRK